MRNPVIAAAAALSLSACANTDFPCFDESTPDQRVWQVSTACQQQIYRANEAARITPGGVLRDGVTPVSECAAISDGNYRATVNGESCDFIVTDTIAQPSPTPSPTI